MPSWTLNLGSDAAPLASCGGKGVNLVRLSRAGFRVPPGFVIVTDAYRAFVEAHGLDDVIAGALTGVDPTDASALEAASASIRSAFVPGSVPAPIADAIRAAHAAAFAPDAALAVRSSATAEDLPELSFAGQQDTFLNVLGIEPVLRAVVDCWSSLWTARAIGYRLRNAINNDDIALAAVVQELVASEVSGVLFTANPLTGIRGETVIDATLGLGEALVSGQVEPDHYVADSATGRVLERSLGEKAVATRPLPGGSVHTSPTDDERPCLSDAQVSELTAVGRRIQAEYGSPQDVEWAIAEGEVFVLQSRAITSLYPLPDGSPPDAIWFSFASVQGMLKPITPLGRDALTLALSGVTRAFGASGFDLREAGYLRPAGERLWVRVDEILRHPIGGRILPRAFAMIDPGAAPVIAKLSQDERWARSRGLPHRAMLRSLAGVASRVLPRLPRTLRDPAGQRRAVDAVAAEALESAGALFGAASEFPTPQERLAARVAATRATLGAAFPAFLPAFMPVMGPALAMLGRLQTLGAQAGEQGLSLVLEALRGLPGNVTTEMDLALWSTAQSIRSDAEALALFLERGPEEVSGRYLSGTLPTLAQEAVSAFMSCYGMRGVGEIDLGQPRWREEPIDLFRSLQAVVKIDDPDKAPDAVFRRGMLAAGPATEQLVEALASGRRGALRARQARFLIDRVRKLLGARETPKFGLIRLFGLVRSGLLASGAELAASGVLDRSDDVFFLRLDELERLAGEPTGLQRRLVAERRAVADRELRRRQIPRLMCGDGRTYFEGVADAADGAITGSPVSPGVAEGSARVVFDPQTAHLLPGDILVCPGTDPAWTPLFLLAGGLITEVGGMMTHGSVVAREYGIPAVVGVHQATARLRDGQRVRLDGTSGTIEILDDAVTPGSAG